jgi:hypothetical protein
VFLVPNVWSSSRTIIAGGSWDFLRQLHGLDQHGVIFDHSEANP